MATRALSADAHLASPEITTNFPSLTRRAFAGIAAGGVAAIASPALATADWSAVDWLARWYELGCGARLDVGGDLQLIPRHAAGSEAADLLAEAARDDRLAMLRRLLHQFKTECPAMRQVRRLEKMDKEFVSAEDQAGHEAWLMRYSRAFDALARTPATSGRGLAAKLCRGLQGIGSETGNRILEDGLKQLTAWR